MVPSTNHTLIIKRRFLLYRLSLKGLIRDKQGNILVVKLAELGWDLPGGGMDHGEDIKSALAREMYGGSWTGGDFTYRIIDADDPIYLEIANVLQVRLIFEVNPITLPSEVGNDGDDLAYMSPNSFRDSSHPIERKSVSVLRKNYRLLALSSQVLLIFILIMCYNKR